MGVVLPPVTQHRSRDELAYARRMAWEAIKNADVKLYEFEQLIIKATLPPIHEEKFVLAEERTTPEIVLNALADDRDADVRLAVARNFYTGIHALSKLAHHDPDMAVREAALNNLKSARTIDFNEKKTDAVQRFLSEFPTKTLTASEKQPLILPFDMEIERQLVAVHSSWRAKPSSRPVGAGPETLIEAVDFLVNMLELPAPPVFCTEGSDTFYCSASTSLAKGADLASGFALRKGETTIYAWETPEEE